MSKSAQKNKKRKEAAAKAKAAAGSGAGGEQGSNGVKRLIGFFFVGTCWSLNNLVKIFLHAGSNTASGTLRVVCGSAIG